MKADFEMVTKCNTKLAAESVAWYSSAKHWKDHNDSDEAMNNLLAEGCQDNRKTLEDMDREHKETIRRLHKRIDEQQKQKKHDGEQQKQVVTNTAVGTVVSRNCRLDSFGVLREQRWADTSDMAGMD